MSVQDSICRLYMYVQKGRPGLDGPGAGAAAQAVPGGPAPEAGAGMPPLARSCQLAPRLRKFPACAAGRKPLQFPPPCSAKRASASSWNPSA